MCEAGGKVYYVTSTMLNNTRVPHIIRMNQDGSEQTRISTDYYDIGSVISDGNIIYFDANIGTYDAPYRIYSLPTGGGEAKKIVTGNISVLQIAGGRLYWVDNPRTPSGEIKHDQIKTLSIKSINFDGSDEKILYSMDVSLVGYTFGFLATDDGLYYYVDGSDYNHCNLYRTDLDGHNTKKLNEEELSDIHKLFYDSGNLYLVLPHKNLDFCDFVNIIDANGKVKPIIKSIGYFPQDYSTIQYCGVSDGMFYYFDLVFVAPGGSSESLKSNLHQYDLKTNRDTIVLFNVEMGDKATKILQSVRGKSISCSGISGLYIVGNDIYFSPYVLP